MCFPKDQLFAQIAIDDHFRQATIYWKLPRYYTLKHTHTHKHVRKHTHKDDANTHTHTHTRNHNKKTRKHTHKEHGYKHTHAHNLVSRLRKVDLPAQRKVNRIAELTHIYMVLF